jgi:arylsulfatase A-like enzyme
MNGDLYNIAFAEEVITEFKPELLVVNLQGVDVCHSNFTEYCDNIRKSDYAVRHLWDKIQATPGMANDTVLIVAPEHGRNYDPNTLIDPYGRRAFDHTGDASSREIFCLIAGPTSVVKQNQLISTNMGESIDIVPTIAWLLGFDSAIPSGLLPGSPLTAAFN